MKFMKSDLNISGIHSYTEFVIEAITAGIVASAFKSTVVFFCAFFCGLLFFDGLECFLCFFSRVSAFFA